MEKATFHEHLTRLREEFPEAEYITIPQAAKYAGFDPRTLRDDRTFPKKKYGKQSRVSIINLARWMAV